MGTMRTAYRFPVGKSYGKRRLGGRKHKWEDTIKWILERYDRVVWSGFIWLRVGRGFL
jgi:hypothetical protein